MLSTVCPFQVLTMQLQDMLFIQGQAKWLGVKTFFKKKEKASSILNL